MSLYHLSAFTKNPTQLSQTEKLQGYLAASVRAVDYPLPVRVATRVLGNLVLALASLGTLGMALPFTLGIWNKIDQQDAFQSIAEAANGHANLKFEKAPHAGWVFTPVFSKLGEGHYQVLIESKKTGHINSVRFKEVGGEITCSHPQFMDGSLPNVDLIQDAFASNARTNQNCDYIGRPGSSPRFGITAQNIILFTAGLFSRPMKAVVRRAWKHKVISGAILIGSAVMTAKVGMLILEHRYLLKFVIDHYRQRMTLSDSYKKSLPTSLWKICFGGFDDNYVLKLVKNPGSQPASLLDSLILEIMQHPNLESWYISKLINNPTQAPADLFDAVILYLSKHNGAQLDSLRMYIAWRYYL